jgi:ElaB/YqjD/DUF883 family membrane-anchored ribosome-binding protein
MANTITNPSTSPIGGAAPSADAPPSEFPKSGAAAGARPAAAIGAAAAGVDAAIDSAAAAEGDVIRRVVQGAHEAVDRIADKAIPAVERLKDTYAGATEAIKHRADQAVDLKDEWTESLRAAVREHPLAAIGTALAIGALLARLTARNDER